MLHAPPHNNGPAQAVGAALEVKRVLVIHTEIDTGSVDMSSDSELPYSQEETLRSVVERCRTVNDQHSQLRTWRAVGQDAREVHHAPLGHVGRNIEEAQASDAVRLDRRTELVDAFVAPQVVRDVELM